MTSVSLGSGDRGRSDWDINLGVVHVEANRHARKLKELLIASLNYSKRALFY